MSTLYYWSKILKSWGASEQNVNLSFDTLEIQEKAEVVVEKIVRNKRKCVTIIKGLDMFGKLPSLRSVHLSQICGYVFFSLKKHMDYLVLQLHLIG